MLLRYNQSINVVIFKKEKNNEYMVKLDCLSICLSIELSFISLAQALDKNITKRLTTVMTRGRIVRQNPFLVSYFVLDVFL